MSVRLCRWRDGSRLLPDHQRHHRVPEQPRAHAALADVTADPGNVFTHFDPIGTCARQTNGTIKCRLLFSVMN